MNAARYWLHRAGLLLEVAAWYAGRPFRAARLALRSLNYEPQHVDPWGPEAERIEVPVVGIGLRIPVTLPAPALEPFLSAPRIVGGERITSDHDHDTDDGCCDVCGQWEAAVAEPELLLGPAWLHAHWWWYAAERQREADDYHNWIEADRRRWRLDNGLAALELAAA